MAKSRDKKRLKRDRKQRERKKRSAQAAARKELKAKQEKSATTLPNLETAHFEFAQQLTLKLISGGKLSPDRFFAVDYPKYHRLLDRVLDQYNAASPQPITCKAGCDACCYYLVALPPIQVLYIRYFVQKHFTPQERDDLRGRLEQAATAEAPLLRQFPDDPLRRAREYHRLQIPCPFLTRERRCSIYEVRPISCRYHSVVSDPSFCFELDDPTDNIRPWKHSELMEKDVMFKKFLSVQFTGSEEMGSLQRLLLPLMD